MIKSIKIEVVILTLIVGTISCTNLKMINPQNTSLIIGKFETTGHSGFLLLSKKIYKGALVQLSNNRDDKIIKSKALKGHPEYFVIKNIQSGEYTINSLQVLMDNNIRLNLNTKNTSFCNLTLQKQGIYYLGNYLFKAEVHGICCDTTSLTQFNQAVPAEIIEELKKENSNVDINNIDTTQRIFCKITGAY